MPGIVRPRQSLNLFGPLAIVQGESYRQLTFVIPGDVTAGVPKGQIRNALREDGGDLIAEFEFDPSTYDPGADETTIYPVLPHPITATIPTTRYQGNGVATARNCYLYDVELKLNGETTKTRPGFIQVIGEVTD